MTTSIKPPKPAGYIIYHRHADETLYPALVTDLPSTGSGQVKYDKTIPPIPLTASEMSLPFHEILARHPHGRTR